MMKKTSQLPKRLFYVWFGDDMPADVHACIQTWKLAMPDYEIIKIGEEKSEWFDFKAALEQCQWLKAIYDRKLWAYVADYVRMKVLYNHGGIYLDTDVTASKSFDPLTSESLFMGFQSPTEVNGAILGGIKHHPFLKSMLDYYEKNEIFKGPRHLLPEIMTYILKRDYNFAPFDSRRAPDVTRLSDIIIYPEETFYPFRYDEKFTDKCITKNNFCIHWWKGSWRSEEDREWLKDGRLTYLEGIMQRPLQPQKNVNPKWLYFVKQTPNKTKYYIFGIPFIVVRKPSHKKYVYLFNTIPLYGK
ncbi:glycosyltransferase [uncultured Bartonella sp.]|uniref:glycosyltransferase n=1 Tax=uncultured Bartonella sp. TaxID=104108 RepID=UPI0025D13275|nr:glycosyltransferase [uncultured Bartonella sp.]